MFKSLIMSQGVFMWATVCAKVYAKIPDTGFLCLFLFPFLAIKETSDEIILQMAAYRSAEQQLTTRLTPEKHDKWKVILLSRKHTLDVLTGLLDKYIASTQSVLNTLLSKQGFVSVSDNTHYMSILEIIRKATLDTYLKRVKGDVKKLYEGFKALTTSLNIPQPVWEE